MLKPDQTLVPNTFVEFDWPNDECIYQLTKSSELLVSERLDSEKGTVGYLAQKYMVSAFNQRNQSMNMVEITVKIFKAEDVPHKEHEVHNGLIFKAFMSGMKFLQFNLDKDITCIRQYPLFSEVQQDERQEAAESEIIGTHVRLLTSTSSKLVCRETIAFKSHNIDEESFDHESEFTFGNLKYFEEQGYIVSEAWLKPEFIQFADDKRCNLLKDKQNELAYNLMNNTLKHMLNGIKLINFAEFIDMP